jgi:hypothetical protein
MVCAQRQDHHLTGALLKHAVGDVPLVQLLEWQPQAQVVHKLQARLLPCVEDDALALLAVVQAQLEVVPMYWRNHNPEAGCHGAGRGASTDAPT